MVHSSAFHPYTRPTVAGNNVSDVSIDESLRMIMSAESLLAFALQESSKRLIPMEHAKQISPPIAASVLPLSAANVALAVPAPVASEQPLQSPNAPSEKSRRKRTTFSSEQATRLETEYLNDSYMAREKRLVLAHSLNLSENQVKTWFQNRRAKDKRDRKTENCSNNTVSRKSSPSRKSSYDSSPTPSHSTPFVLPSTHQTQTASSPTTVESMLLPSTPPASIIQKVDQFPTISNLELLNNYLKSFSNPQINSAPSFLGASSSPLFNPNMLISFQSPLQPATF